MYVCISTLNNNNKLQKKVRNENDIAYCKKKSILVLQNYK